MPGLSQNNPSEKRYPCWKTNKVEVAHDATTAVLGHITIPSALDRVMATPAMFARQVRWLGNQPDSMIR
jgi:hypothetical protein